MLLYVDLAKMSKPYATVIVVIIVGEPNLGVFTFYCFCAHVQASSSLAANLTIRIDAEHNYCTSDLAPWLCFLQAGPKRQ